jgi:hypothetical protein
MARQPRNEFPGAFYHVMSRGDRHEPIFEDDDDRRMFLRTLTEWPIDPANFGEHSKACPSDWLAAIGGD